MNNRAFSIVELLISMVILAIGLLGIMGGFYYTQKQTDKTIEKYSAFKAGNHYLDQVKIQPINDTFLAKNQVTIYQTDGSPITLTLGEWNSVQALDFAGDTVGTADDIELQVMPVITAVNGTSGDYYSIALNYRWRQSGDQTWETDILKTTKLPTEYAEESSQKAGLYYSPKTVVTTSGDKIEIKILSLPSYYSEYFMADGIPSPEAREAYLRIYAEHYNISIPEPDSSPEKIDSLVNDLESGKYNHMVINNDFFIESNMSNAEAKMMAFHNAIHGVVGLNDLDMLFNRLGVSREQYNKFMKDVVDHMNFVTITPGEASEETISRSEN